MAKEFKLTYFNVRGRAEATRLLFKLAGKDFIDNRVQGESWQSFKPSTPKGQIPVLEVDGNMMCESNAIARYVAREFNLYGANNWEAAVCDEIMDSVTAVFDPLASYRYTAKTEEEKAAALEKVENAVKSLEKLVALRKKGQYVLGENASLADTVLYTLIEFCQSSITDYKGDNCPTVAAIAKKYSEIPAIAEWIKNRPESTV